MTDGVEELRRSICRTYTAQMFGKCPGEHQYDVTLNFALLPVRYIACEISLGLALL